MSEKNGIVRIPGNQSVDGTVERLKAILQARGITLFALVDHSGDAAKSGMQMPNTKLLIFGNPNAGTPVMLASPYARFISGHTLVVDGANWQRRLLTNPPVVTVREQMGKGPFEP